MLFLWFKHLFNIFIAYIRFHQIKISYTYIITKKTFLKQKNPLPTGEGRLSKRYSNGIWIRIEIGSLRLAAVLWGRNIFGELRSGSYREPERKVPDKQTNNI